MMKRWLSGGLLGPLLALSAWAAPPPTAAEAADAWRETQVLRVGFHADAPPFSKLPAGTAQPIGFSIELCNQVIADIAQQLHLTRLRVQYVPVLRSQRMDALETNTIDMVCASATITEARLERVAFSYAYFVAQMRFMVPVESAIKSLGDLNGKRLAIVNGSTADKVFSRLGEGELRQTQFQRFSTSADAFDALDKAEVDAMALDDVLLAGLAAERGKSSAYRLSEQALSVEPYGIMMRKGDAQLMLSTDVALRKMFAGDHLDPLYQRWFSGSNGVALPMPAMTREVIRRPTKEPGIATIVGYKP